jgi:hypothetical protein
MTWTELTALSETNLNDLETRISNAATAVTDGKTLVAASITTMGQASTVADSFAVMAGKIEDISTDADAVVAHILAPETAYVGGVKITGTMVDRTGDTAAASSTVSGTTLKLRATEGYRDGVNDNVTITDADFVDSNIKDGVNLFGKLGTYVGGAVLTGDMIAENLLSGKTGYSNDAATKITGTMPDNAGDVAAVSAHMSGTTIHVVPATGYTDGSDDASTIDLTTVDADLAATNIKDGVTVLGQLGTYGKVASGSFTMNYANATTDKADLGFNPTTVMVSCNYTGNEYTAYINPDRESEAIGVDGTLSIALIAGGFRVGQNFMSAGTPNVTVYYYAVLL